MGLYQVWQYFEAKRSLQKAEKALEDSQSKIKTKEVKIEENKEIIQCLEREIESITSNNQSVSTLDFFMFQRRLGTNCIKNRKQMKNYKKLNCN